MKTFQIFEIGAPRRAIGELSHGPRRRKAGTD
jgi:hypothetical protein